MSANGQTPVLTQDRGSLGIPDTAPQPQDHKRKKVKVLEAEAGDGYIIVTQCGITLRIPVGDKIPLASVMAFTNGDDFGGTRALLGDEQWEKFLAAGPTIADYNELGEKLQAATGK